MKWKIKLTPFVMGVLQIVLIVFVLVLGIAANFLLTNSGSAPGQSSKGADTLFVEVMTPRVVSTTLRAQETGIVQARNTVSFTPQVSGQVVEISKNLASGGVFDADEVLFRLDAADYSADVDQAKADVASAQAKLQLELAEAEIAKREWNLVYPDEDIPDLVARGPQIAQAEAAVESAKARLQAANLNLKRVAFSLPFPGRIVSTSVEMGQRLSANQSYGQAYALDSLEVSVPIDAGILSAFEPIVGRPATVTIGTREFTREIAGWVIRSEAELDQVTRLGRVIVGFEKPTNIIPGSFVNVEIQGPETKNALLIPEQAMSEARVAWVVNANRLEKRTLKFLGLNAGGDFIVAPFDFGEGIVTSPLSSPTESMPVEIVATPQDR